jgi:outer membrane protein
MDSMKNQIIALVALAIGVTALALHFTRKTPKVGYAETAVLMSEFSEAVKARKEFEAAQKEWDANLKSLNDSLMATMERMKTDYDKAPAAAKESMRHLLQKRNDDLQRYTNAVKKMAVDKEKELMDPVVRKLNAHLDSWGKGHGYDMILGTMTGGNILQANAEFNVTAQVLKDLNQTYRDLPVAETAARTDVPKDSVGNTP